MNSELEREIQSQREKEKRKIERGKEKEIVDTLRLQNYK